MPRLLWLALSAIVCGSVATALRSQTAVASNFDQVVAPFVQQNCAGCHNDKLKVAGLVLTTYHDAPSLVRDRDIWEKVIR
ncbi:MAG TPA: hypothetical protein VFA65_16735, partial [Bryobacteraceae bacterium]|nr:hypothetical protein [Bryobacteraceae bacterium]